MELFLLTPIYYNSEPKDGVDLLTETFVENN
jgi:hypothetical protein